MDQNKDDQAWQKLQTHIEQMFGRYFRNSLDLIEYKPQCAVHLLSMSLGDREGSSEGILSKVEIRVR